MNSRRKTIIITGLLAILISYIVMTPKEEEKAYFTLYIGDKAEQIEMTADWDATMDTVMVKLQPLWENLKEGESETFYIERSGAQQPSWYKAGDIGEEGRTPSVTSTVNSSEYRFFKNRQIGPETYTYGYESVKEDGSGDRAESRAGEADWTEMKKILSERLDYMKEDIIL